MLHLLPDSGPEPQRPDVPEAYAEALSRLANEVGPRFAPCDRLAEMARLKKRFYED